MSFLLCEVHTGTGIYEPFSVLAISCLGVVVILRLDRTAATCFITTVADIRCTFDLPTFFSFKARTDRVTSQATSSICSFTFLLKRVPTEINVTHISKLCHEKRSPNCHKCCKHMHFSFLTLTKKYYYCQSNRNRCCNNHSSYHIVVPPYLRISSRFCILS